MFSQYVSYTTCLVIMFLYGTWKRVNPMYGNFAPLNYGYVTFFLTADLFAALVLRHHLSDTFMNGVIMFCSV